MVQTISVNFEESVDEWMKYINKQKSGSTPFFAETNFTSVKKILSLIFAKLVEDKQIVETDDPNVVDFIDYAKYNTRIIEDAFYRVMKDLSGQVSPASLRVYACCGRKALSEIGLKRDRLKLPAREKTIKSESNNALPPKIRALEDDNELKLFFIERLKHLEDHKSIHSKTTITNMMRYWQHVANLFEVTEDKPFLQQDFSVNNIVSLVKDPTDHQIIDLYHMFEGFNDEWESMTIKKLKAYYPKRKKEHKNEDLDGDDGDHHRLSAKQQENILKACETPFEQLMVSLLFSTGLRVNGLRMIKLKDICDQKTSPVTIFEYGKTSEKGNKIRTFPIMEMVKNPLLKWIDQNHMLGSEYLFPSPRISSKPMSVINFQTTFKKIAKRAGYDGPEVHVHAARHSVAFNLLESGNSMDKIGKFLGHANPSTTAKFYAKMSTRETVERMNTECLGGENKIKQHIPDVPNFGKVGKERKKKRNPLGKLKDVVINIT